MTGSVLTSYRSFLLLLLTTVLPIAYPVHLLVDHGPDHKHHEEHEEPGHEKELVCSVCVIFNTLEVLPDNQRTTGYFFIISDTTLPDFYLPEPLRDIIPRAPPAS